MNKNYLNKSQEDKQLEFMADPKNRRFLLENQDDVNKLFGKIRRLKGRNEIRKNAIKIAVKLRLNIDPLLDSWDDVGREDSSDSGEFSLMEDSANFEDGSTVNFRYIPREERNKIPDKDFGLVTNNGKRRLYPIIDDLSVEHSLQWLDKLNETDEVKLSVKNRIIKIARRKKLKIPEEYFSEDSVTIG